MKWYKLTSSHIARANWRNNPGEPEGGDLTIQFVDGSQYRYSAVPKRVFEGLRKAPSPGRFFDSNIRPRYGAQMIRLSDKRRREGGAEKSPSFA